eukprot:scaffold13502_cov70-Phaeocystis_antarctica.AAC.7
MLRLPKRVPQSPCLVEHLGRCRFSAVVDGVHESLELARFHGLAQRCIRIGVPMSIGFRKGLWEVLRLPERIPQSPRLIENLRRSRIGVLVDRVHEALKLARLHGLAQRCICGAGCIKGALRAVACQGHSMGERRLLPQPMAVARASIRMVPGRGECPLWPDI